MAPPRIEAQEIETYWNIFSARTNGGQFLTGEQAAPVLKNSGLRDDQLEQQGQAEGESFHDGPFERAQK